VTRRERAPAAVLAAAATSSAGAANIRPRHA
jgi:hypothetical protein